MILRPALRPPLRDPMRAATALKEGGGGWTPARLFPGAGAWYDPSDLSTMFQNSNGTTAVAVGDPVGYIADKSGNGNHAIQATAGNRPILRQDADSRYYLEGDGSNDILVASISAVAFDRAMMVCAAQIDSTGATGNDEIFACGNSANSNPFFTIRRTSANLYGVYRSTAAADVTAAHSITTGADGRHVFSALAADAAASIRMDGAELAVGPGVPASATIDRIALMGLVRTTTSNWAPGRFYHGVVLFREVTAQELTDTENYVAQAAFDAGFDEGFN